MFPPDQPAEKSAFNYDLYAVSVSCRKRKKKRKKKSKKGLADNYFNLK
jgi:hypothetical protein